jgi:hypothetical protein
MDLEELSSPLRQRDRDARPLTSCGGLEQPFATEAVPHNTLIVVALKITALMAAIAWASATMASWFM